MDLPGARPPATRRQARCPRSATRPPGLRHTGSRRWRLSSPAPGSERRSSAADINTFGIDRQRRSFALARRRARARTPRRTARAIAHRLRHVGTAPAGGGRYEARREEAAGRAIRRRWLLPAKGEIAWGTPKHQQTTRPRERDAGQFRRVVAKPCRRVLGPRWNGTLHRARRQRARRNRIGFQRAVSVCRGRPDRQSPYACSS